MQGVQQGKFRAVFDFLVMLFFLHSLSRNHDLAVDFAYPIDEDLARFLQSPASVDCLAKYGNPFGVIDGLSLQNADLGSSRSLDKLMEGGSSEPEAEHLPSLSAPSSAHSSPLSAPVSMPPPGPSSASSAPGFALGAGQMGHLGEAPAAASPDASSRSAAEAPASSSSSTPSSSSSSSSISSAKMRPPSGAGRKPPTTASGASGAVTVVPVLAPAPSSPSSSTPAPPAPLADPRSPGDPAPSSSAASTPLAPAPPAEVKEVRVDMRRSASGSSSVPMDISKIIAAAAAGLPGGEKKTPQAQAPATPVAAAHAHPSSSASPSHPKVPNSVAPSSTWPSELGDTHRESDGQTNLKGVQIEQVFQSNLDAKRENLQLKHALSKAKRELEALQAAAGEGGEGGRKRAEGHPTIDLANALWQTPVERQRGEIIILGLQEEVAALKAQLRDAAAGASTSAASTPSSSPSRAPPSGSDDASAALIQALQQQREQLESALSSAFERVAAVETGNEQLKRELEAARQQLAAAGAAGGAPPNLLSEDDVNDLLEVNGASAGFWVNLVSEASELVESLMDDSLHASKHESVFRLSRALRQLGAENAALRQRVLDVAATRRAAGAGGSGGPSDQSMLQQASAASGAVIGELRVQNDLLRLQLLEANEDLARTLASSEAIQLAAVASDRNRFSALVQRLETLRGEGQRAKLKDRYISFLSELVSKQEQLTSSMQTCKTVDEAHRLALLRSQYDREAINILQQIHLAGAAPVTVDQALDVSTLVEEAVQSLQMQVSRLREDCNSLREKARAEQTERFSVLRRLRVLEAETEHIREGGTPGQRQTSSQDLTSSESFRLSLGSDAGISPRQSLTPRGSGAGVAGQSTGTFLRTPDRRDAVKVVPAQLSRSPR